ncbi:unnamed protein product [Rotaria sp. Silwood1]|nr:unnamed protein product [Rotaria sp. Silwood1]CAF0969788.1 unnamed protein product [Rotaria sp. Silwood1]CAF3406608.1 unnamed protein product [Rotaria sp. Silwood1]CAF3414886.1 unnamed protein product [Rotaria sp. Silwood1]CAF3415272.1 unnamed protein product [Rotaria sp. Silwood1]
MNIIQSNNSWNIPVQNSLTNFNILRENNPLQIIADTRFHTIIVRATKQNSIAPFSPTQMIRSERSSWSSASIVSSIDLKSPEPILHTEVYQKLETMNKTSKNRKLVIILIILLTLLILIIIIIVLTLTLIKNSSTETTIITSPTTTKI